MLAGAVASSTPVSPAPVLILGATSAIARALAHEMAHQGHRLVLAARDEAELNAVSADVRLRFNIDVAALRFDATDFSSHPSFFADALQAFPEGLGGVILCHGLLGDAMQARSNRDLCRQIIDVNFTSAVSVLELAAAHFEAHGAAGRAFICAISSVAGDRGRQSNYIYGSSKGALTIYLQGLRNRLFPAGVAVITIKPGFVDTAMTWGLLKPNSPIVASPQRVARDIARAIRRRSNVVYTPFFWRAIMRIIKSIPEPIFKRLKL